MKTYLVTGASRGIGYSIAKQLLEEDARVFCTYNTSHKEASALKNNFSNCELIQADFSREDSVAEVVKSLAGVVLDGLVNNAGMFEMDGFANWDSGVWNKVFTVNLFSPVNLTMVLRENFAPNASIVNISSLDGMTGSFHSMAYSASKAALLNVTQSLANNFGKKGIRVNAIARSRLLGRISNYTNDDSWKYFSALDLNDSEFSSERR